VRRRRLGAAARLAGALVAAVAFTVVTSVPAGAHGADGTMGIEVLPGSAPLTAKVRVLVEYANDGEVAPGATVVATATAADGATVGPVALTDEGQGNYGVTMTLTAPGQWSVAVTATNPAATAEATVSVSAAASTSGATGAGADDRLDDSRQESQTQRAHPPEESSDGPSPVLLAVIGIVLIAAAAATFALVRRRNRALTQPRS